jgi:ABC-type transport system involved in multi-copper enzyme maturation permease subunit
MSEADGRDKSRPVPFLKAARAAYALSFEGLLWSRRSLFVGLLLGFPALLAVLYRMARLADVSTRASGLDVYGMLVSHFFLANALPLAALFYATALVAEEVEGRTLVYLITRPVARAAVLVGKFTAYLVTALTLSLPAAVLSFLLLASTGGASRLGAAAPGMLRDLGVMALALLAYGALFALLGVVLRRPLVPGLLFLYGWELVVYLPGKLPRLTLTAWLRSLVPYRVPSEGLSELLATGFATGESLLVLGCVTLVALAAAIAIFTTREYVMEQ